MFSDIATPAIAGGKIDSGGACWADIDRDGDADLFVANYARHQGDKSRLWRNDGDGRFTDVGDAAGVSMPDFERSTGCAFADLDNDGDPDLYVTVKATKSKGDRPKGSRLFQNNGDGTFTDTTEAAGVGMLGKGSASSDWADYDADGDYDGFVATRDETDLNGFFEQLRPLSFRDIGAAKGLADPMGAESVFMGSWFDYDADGDLDILLAIDWWGLELYRNDGGAFTRVTTTAFPKATDSTPGAPPNNPMGVTWGDYDGDGCVDLFVSGMNVPGQGGFDVDVFTADSPSRLYRNNCDGTFSDATRTAGFIATGLVEWSVNFVDYDNDGDLDLSVVAGNTSEQLPKSLGRPRSSSRKIITLVASAIRKIVPSRWVAWAYRYEMMIPASGALGPGAAMPNMLYQNQLVETGAATFVDVTNRVGAADVGTARGSAWADIDNDGDLDWFIPAKGTPSRLYRNNGPVGNYLRVHLVGSPLRDAVGAWVKIKVGNRYQQRHVHVLDGYLSQSQMDPHFGLGKVGTVDEIRVRWPGTTAWMLACSVVPANVKVTITQGGGCRW
ncbi:MAG: CRTAC1 family protein [Armatimonadota bacterium]